MFLLPREIYYIPVLVCRRLDNHIGIFIPPILAVTRSDNRKSSSRVQREDAFIKSWQGIVTWHDDNNYDNTIPARTGR